jgi:nucleoside-diphosphate-sugar epimerase
MSPRFAPPATKILITGANGFVGRVVSAAAKGPTLRVTVRTGSIEGLDAEQIKIGNIDANTDWSQALVGVDRVVHLAARVHVMKPSRDDATAFERTNVLGTQHLGEAAARAGVKQFVFLSSVKVNGEATTTRSFGPDDTPYPEGAYARSKHEAELHLERIAAATGMGVAIIRAPLVYGPGVRANFRRMLSWIYRGVPLPLASIDNRRSLLSVWNLSDLILTLLRAEHPIGAVFMASDGQSVSTPELIRRLAEAMGRPARLLPISAGVLRACARLAGAEAEFRRLSSSLTVDMSATQTRLGWSPPMSFERGLMLTAQWYLHEMRAHAN